MKPAKEKERPLLYISLGTVINDRPDFYDKCFKAFKDMEIDVIISCGNTVKIGLVDIPMDRIVGTWTDGRKTAFAGNFMPLLDETTEFGGKWINLCEAHLGETGITDPITCLEYLGKFYIQEGNKRVSVLKSYNAPSIPGIVTRIIPQQTDDLETQIYFEFMDFFKVSRTYLITFSQRGGYAKLQAALGFAPDQVWTDDERRGFSSDFRKFSMVFEELNTEKLPITAGDALLEYLEVHAFQEIKKLTADELRASLSSIWADRPVSVGMIKYMTGTFRFSGAARTELSTAAATVLSPGTLSVTADPPVAAALWEMTESAGTPLSLAALPQPHTSITAATMRASRVLDFFIVSTPLQTLLLPVRS